MPTFDIQNVYIQAPAIVYGNRPSSNWPSTGRVQFERYSTRYREGLDLVLKEITCDINGGEKVVLIFDSYPCTTKLYCVGRNSWQNRSWQVIADPGIVSDY